MDKDQANPAFDLVNVGGKAKVAASAGLYGDVAALTVIEADCAMRTLTIGRSHHSPRECHEDKGFCHQCVVIKPLNKLLTAPPGWVSRL
jgi:hypothetical protein